MQLVHIYLTFPGTCEEAFSFYEGVFESHMEGLIRFGDADFAGPVSAKYQSRVMNVHMPITGHVHLMGADSVEGFGPPLVIGNNFNITLVAENQSEADRAFSRLSVGGRVTMPMANAPWGPYFGMCVDKYSIQWMISLDHPV